VNFVPIEEMENRRVLVLANLKPRAMRGIESHGMVLCTSNSDKSKVEPLLVPEGVEVGERIFFGDTPSVHEPDAELNPKKKYFESVQPDWKTKDDKIAYYQDLPFNTPKGPITTASIAGGTIS
jgi:aminoacyl tRNA synthase complex-interacting multifunctional protein 1